MKKILFLLAVSIGFLGHSQAQDVNDITKKVLAACANADNITYDFTSFERFSNKKVNSHIEFKYQSSPLKIYANSLSPTKAQLLYIPSQSSKVQVKKGLKIKLDRHSSMLIKDQHHSIDNAGFGTFKRIIEQSIKSKGLTVNSPKLASFIKVLGTVTYDGKKCWAAEINDDDYRIINHKVAADETTVWKLGAKLAIPEYRVKELNDIGNELTPGQIIKIPSSYAKKTTVYIDQATYLPIYQKMEDDKGVYEIYEFKNLKTNVKFTNSDFTL